MGDLHVLIKAVLRDGTERERHALVPEAMVEQLETMLVKSIDIRSVSVFVRRMKHHKTFAEDFSDEAVRRGTDDFLVFYKHLEATRDAELAEAIRTAEPIENIDSHILKAKLS